ncbi:hypothetical protein BDV06DRAFT_30775 [Aspergillus oleicola]
MSKSSRLLLISLWWCRCNLRFEAQRETVFRTVLILILRCAIHNLYDIALGGAVPVSWHAESPRFSRANPSDLTFQIKRRKKLTRLTSLLHHIINKHFFLLLFPPNGGIDGFRLPVSRGWQASAEAVPEDAYRGTQIATEEQCAIGTIYLR